VKGKWQSKRGVRKAASDQPGKRLFLFVRSFLVSPWHTRHDAATAQREFIHPLHRLISHRHTERRLLRHDRLVLPHPKGRHEQPVEKPRFRANRGVEPGWVEKSGAV